MGAPNVLYGYAYPSSGNRPEFVRIDGADSGANEAMFAYAFDDTTDEVVDVPFSVPSDYGSGGFTLKVHLGRATGTAAANVRIGAAIRCLNTAEDRDTTDHAYDFNEVTVAMPTSVGTTVVGTITFTDGTDADSIAAGEQGILRLRREPSDTTNDTLSGDMYLYTQPGILFYET